jgi:hypothetical protein
LPPLVRVTTRRLPSSVSYAERGLVGRCRPVVSKTRDISEKPQIVPGSGPIAHDSIVKQLIFLAPFLETGSPDVAESAYT